MCLVKCMLNCYYLAYLNDFCSLSSGQGQVISFGSCFGNSWFGVNGVLFCWNRGFEFQPHPLATILPYNNNRRHIFLRAIQPSLSSYARTKSHYKSFAHLIRATELNGIDSSKSISRSNTGATRALEQIDPKGIERGRGGCSSRGPQGACRRAGSGCRRPSPDRTTGFGSRTARARSAPPCFLASILAAVPYPSPTKVVWEEGF